MTVPPSRSLLPVFIGVGLTIVFLFGLGYLANQRRNAQPATPALRVLAPGGAPVDSPLIVRFTSSRPLQLTANGWISGDWHLHARINDVEYMPAAAEISRADSSYVWTIPAVQRGPLTLKLGWADRRHRETSAGSSDVVRTILR